MYLHSDKNLVVGLRKNSGLHILFLLMLTSLMAFSQQYPLQVNIAITPPFSTKISDYTSNPNKMLVTVHNMSFPARQQQIYLMGEIRSSGGIRLYTKPGQKPTQPISIMPNGIFKLNLNNIQDVFGTNRLAYEGINEQQILYGNGLPEDDYTICIRAFDFATNTPLSGEEPFGCSATFSISNLESPTITQPFCGSELTAISPQNVIFSWTMPAGAPLTTRYKIRIVEVNPPEHNINNAFNSASHPVFFELNVTGNVFVYGAAHPSLVTGKTYAFAVTAFDPLGRAVFRNGGQSEVCSFLWKSSYVLPDILPIDTLEPYLPVVIGDVTIVPPPINAPTNVTGKLQYKYAEAGDNKTYPLAGANVKLVVAHVETNRNVLLTNENVLRYILSPHQACVDSEVGKTLAVTTTDANGNFDFNFFSNKDFGKICSGAAEISRDYHRVALIMIQTPHKSFYFNPEMLILPVKGTSNNLQNVIAKVRSYQIDVTAKPTTNLGEIYYQAMDIDVLSGINVYLVRKNNSTTSLFPFEDGKLAGQTYQAVPASILNKFPGFQVVAHGTTFQGVVRFQRVVWHRDPNFRYYLIAEVPPNSDLNFTFGAPSPISPPQTIPFQTGNIDPATEPFAKYYTYHTYEKSVHLKAEYPRIYGQIKEMEEPKPIAGARVNLTEYYNFSPSVDPTFLYPTHKMSYYGSLIDCAVNSGCNTYVWGEVMITASDGAFAFNDLAMLFSRKTEKISGPERKITFSKNGYDSKQVNIGILKFGKQMALPNIKLKKGAELTGVIRDAERGDLLSNAWVKLPQGKSYKSDALGKYMIPVPLLPNVQQQLIVEKNNFITDTVSFIANKKTQTKNLYLYSIKRRLKVFVRVAGQILVPVEDAIVSLPEITFPNNTGQYYPLSTTTNSDGIAELSFENAGTDNNIVYKVRVGMHESTNRNFETKIYQIKIPVSKNKTTLYCNLPRAACLQGYVYAGQGTESPVSGATVRHQGAAEPLNAYSGYGGSGEGSYKLSNFPVRFFSQNISAMKSLSNFIGDEKSIRVNSPSNQCINVDFNLTVYDDMDITRLMGFPMEVTKLIADTVAGVVEISGNITQLPPNEQFKLEQSAIIPFKNISIVPSSETNSQGVPLAEPATLPVEMDLGSLDNIVINNTFKGKLTAPQQGKLTIDRQAAGSAFGVIKSRVSIPSTEFNSSGVSLPQIWIAGSDAVGTGKMLLPVFAANPAVSKPVTLPATGFWVCDSEGEAFNYSFPNFNQAAHTNLSKSHLNGQIVLLSTILHTNCNNITPADLQIDLGQVEITKNSFSINSAATISMDLGLWKLNSDDWEMSSNGIILNNSVIKTGSMDVPVKNVEITSTTINRDKTIADFNNVKILGTLPVNVTTTNKGLGFYNTSEGFQWLIYANSDGGPQVGYIENLPGLEGQNLPIAGIELFSNGSTPNIAPEPKTLKLFGLVDFLPIDGTSINIFENADPPWFKVIGIFKPGIPYVEQFNGNAAWVKKPSGMEFLIDNPNSINFTHNNMAFLWQTSSLKISNDLFTANGTATEAGKLGPVDIVLNHKNASTEIDIPPDEKIFITQNQSKYFTNVVGGMEVNKSINQWNNFWFEGEMVGMNGISNAGEPSRLKFVCNGEISAEGQNINVSKLDDFPGMSFTYDFINSRLIGSLDIDKNLSGMHAQGVANCIFDPNGWYLNIGGQITIPGIGGCGLFGLFGDYAAVPPEIGNLFGALKCIPLDFQNKVSGFLLQGTLTKQLIPSIEWGVTLPLIDQFVGVQLKADLSMTARTWMSFNPEVNTYGISLLADGYVQGGVSSGLFRVSAFANAQLGITGSYYSNGDYEVLGCGSVKAGVEAEVFYGIDWTGVSLVSPDVGLKMKIGNTGTSFNLILGSCGENLCP